MKWRVRTGLFIVGFVALGIAYDLLAYALGGNDATISRVFLGAHFLQMFVGYGFTFLAGVLIGHIFLPQVVIVYTEDPPPEKGSSIKLP
jgi:hypothetical protein